MPENPQIIAGRKVVATSGTAERLIPFNIACKKICVFALDDNQNEVFVGNGPDDWLTPELSGDPVKKRIELKESGWKYFEFGGACATSSTDIASDKTRGVPLSHRGVASYEFEVTRTDQLWIDAETSGEGVTYLIHR